MKTHYYSIRTPNIETKNKAMALWKHTPLLGKMGPHSSGIPLNHHTEDQWYFSFTPSKDITYDHKDAVEAFEHVMNMHDLHWRRFDLEDILESVDQERVVPFRRPEVQKAVYGWRPPAMAERTT